METGERLAAYLAGELDGDGRAAVEAELARDPRLRTKLERIRATDAALADLPPVEPPAGFAERLRAAVRAELDDRLPAEGDELAARRARRGGVVGRSWWPQVAVAAAVLAIAGIGITQLATGGADQETATDEAAGGLSATTQEAAAGPTVVAVGRSFDAESLRDLADDARFDEVVGQGLEGESAAVAAEEFGTALQDDTGDGDAARATAGGATEADEAPAASADAPEVLAETGAFGLRTVGDVTEEDLEAVRACLPSLVEAESAVIPVYAEIVTFDGQDAIVYGLVGNDPAQESYRRVELWVLARGDCHTLHFAQVDR